MAVTKIWAIHDSVSRVVDGIVERCQLLIRQHQLPARSLSHCCAGSQASEIFRHIHAAFLCLSANGILLGFIDSHIDFLCSIPHRYHILSAGLQGRAPFVSADTGDLGAAGLHKSHARYPYG